MFGLAFNLVLFALLLFLAWRVYLNWRESSGTVWERIKDTFDRSATLFWGWLLTAAGFLLDGAFFLSTWLNAPEVTAWIKAHITPERAGTALAVIGVVTIIARLRSIVRN